MALAVCPSAFIRLAVAMWSPSFTFLRRPNLVPLAEMTPLQGGSLP